MTHALLVAAWVAGQVPSVSFMDDGAIVGRVCVDRDGDGRCSVDEPGLAAARVVLDTGLTAITDAQGRYHLASVPGRALAEDGVGAARMLPGRHRAKVDRRWLMEGATAVPDGATFELPMGGLVVVDFAVRLPAAAARQPQLSPSGGPPLLAKGRVQYDVALEQVEGRALRVQGLALEGGKATVILPEGEHQVPVSSSSPGSLELFVHPVDVVARPSSTLIIPRPLRAVGSVTVDPRACCAPNCLWAPHWRWKATPSNWTRAGRGQCRRRRLPSL